MQRKTTGKGGSSYVATNSKTSAGTSGKSRVRLWPGKGMYGSGEGDSKGVSEATATTGYTETSAELGLPIEGYMVGDRRSGMVGQGGGDGGDGGERKGEMMGLQEMWKPMPSLQKGSLAV